MEHANSTDQTRKWGMLLHLSQLGSYLVPLAGLVAPIVIWQVKKEELPELDAHGRAVANWIISAVLYGLGFGVLSAFFIGIPLLIALAIANAVFAIIGGIKARDGGNWKYPLSFEFLREPSAAVPATDPGTIGT